MRYFISLLFFFFSLHAIAQNQDSIWIVNNYTKQEVYIPMRDGIKLFTSVYIPKDHSEKHPILITRTPYSAAPYGVNNFKTFSSNHYREYFKENYIMVVQDVRGRYMSEGEFIDVRPFITAKTKQTDVDEASDTYDTIDWLIHHISNNNGNAGVFGISYPGFYSTMAALCGHPALKAVSPQAPVTEWFIGDDFHHNGAFMLMDGFAFYSGFGKPRPMPTTVSAEPFNFPVKDNYEFYLRTGALPNFTKIMGDSIKFWKDLMNHPDYDTWWQARNTRNFVQHISPGTATLVVGGLFDAEDCFGAWNLYKSIEQRSKNNNKLVMGPWSHGLWARGTGSSLGNIQFGSATSEWYAQNIEVPFFNYYLKGKGSPDLSEATVFFTGENRWHKLDQWPPKNVQFKDLYLQPQGNLSWNKPGAKNKFSEYTSDPAKPVPYTEDVHLKRTKEYMTDDQRFAARRPDVLVFQTGILDNDVTLAGPVIADLMTSISTTDADFVVKLIDVFPDDFKYSDTDKYVMSGYQMLVRGEVFRGKYRNSFSKSEAFIPGKITEVKYTLPDVAHVFKKGHRIMIQVQSSWFPLVDRNPQKFMDIYHAKDTDFQKALIKIYHTTDAASKIILPVLQQ
jgi:putative CocE/NonD family hydrolase